MSIAVFIQFISPLTLRALSLMLILLGSIYAQRALAEDEEGAVASVTQYVEIRPSFVTNFGSAQGKLKYVKADVAVRVSSAEAAATIESHFPLIRHEIIMTLGEQDDQTLSSTAGQENVRTVVLEKVQTALVNEVGKTLIEDLLFTSFVIQR